MNILKRLFNGSLPAAWNFSADGIIWKLQATPGGILIGESRDIERKTMSLFALRISNGRPLFQGKSLEEPWWIALEMTIGELALLHRYPKPDMPNTLGVTVLDCETGDILWQDEQTRIICGTEDIALAQRGETPDRGELLLLDLRTGAILETIGGNLQRAADFQSICEDRQLPGGWINSTTVAEDDPRFLGLAEEITRNIPAQRGNMEMASFGRYTIVGGHTRSRNTAEAMLANQLDTIVMVFEDRRLVYREVVSTNAPGPSDEIFFIWNGLLIFIREGRQLVAVNLQST